MFVNFVYTFKEPALGFIDFFNCFLISILFISSLIFIISFLLMTLSFVYLFFLILLVDTLNGLGHILLRMAFEIL